MEVEDDGHIQAARTPPSEKRPNEIRVERRKATARLRQEAAQARRTHRNATGSERQLQQSGGSASKQHNGAKAESMAVRVLQWMCRLWAVGRDWEVAVGEWHGSSGRVMSGE